VGTTSDTPASAGVGEGHLTQDQHRLGRAETADTGTVANGHRLRVDGVHAAGGAQGVGELAADLGHLPQRDERREREQREERQHGRVEPARGDERGAGRDHGEPAPARHGVLTRQVGQERHPRVEIRAGPRGQLFAPGGFALEGHDLGDALDRVHGVGAEVA
jgi:hypothetical protein